MSSIQKESPEIGVVGIGLMGSSIVSALLLAGHRVVAVAPVAEDMIDVNERVTSQLAHAAQVGLLGETIEQYLERLIATEDYSKLATCELVLECVIEIPSIKAQVYKKITDVISAEAILGTNTSAIPISVLQKTVQGPERFIGLNRHT